MPRGVASRYFEGGGGNIRGQDARVGQLVRKSDGDATRAYAHIGDAKLRVPALRVVICGNAETLQGDFDHVLGFRAWNQYCRSNFEIQTPEFLMAGEVLRGDAAGTLRDQRKISLVCARIKFVLRIRVDPGAVASQGVHQQQFGSEGRRRNVFAFELCDGVAERSA